MLTMLKTTTFLRLRLERRLPEFRLAGWLAGVTWTDSVRWGQTGDSSLESGLPGCLAAVIWGTLSGAAGSDGARSLEDGSVCMDLSQLATLFGCYYYQPRKAMTPYGRGTSDTTVQQFYSAGILRYSGTTVQRYYGTTVLRYCRAVLRYGKAVLWYSGSTVQWYCGTAVL